MNQPDPSSTRYAALVPAKWLYVFLAVQFACQVALVAPLGSLRTGFRVASFGISLVYLAVLPPRGPRHPARALVYAVIGLPVLGFLHPALNSPLAGLAQIALTLAVWAPMFWVTRIRVTPEVFRRTVLLLWAFHTLSSFVGVLQVYDPGRFAPEPEFVKQGLGALADGLKVRLADGTDIWRPMGLTDTPGGAASSGQFAVLAGLALAVAERGRRWQIAGLLSAAVGMFCIYLCQIRTIVVLTGLGIALYLALQIVKGEGAKALRVAVAATAIVVGSYIWATALGGATVTNRLSSLTEERADKVYYNNRGMFLEATIEELPEYPFGAGLGRYGMMGGYFGDPSNAASPPLWVEIQITAWVYDGGIFLLLAGVAAVAWLCWFSVRAASRYRRGPLSDYSSVVAALNIGLLANTLTFCVFLSGTGLMLLLLNATLFAAMAAERLPPRGRE